MSVQSKIMYVAQCDHPGCEVTSDDFDKGNNTLYDTPGGLAEAFTYWEGGLDDWGWLSVDGKHYCGDHTTWDDDDDKRVPMVSGVVPVTEEGN